MAPLQAAVSGRLAELEARLRCPATGTTIAEARRLEQSALQPLPVLGEPFDVIAARRVHRDALISFEGPSTDRVVAPVPLGRRGQAQVLMDPGLPAPTAVARALETYAALIDGARR